MQVEGGTDLGETKMHLALTEQVPSKQINASETGGDTYLAMPNKGNIAMPREDSLDDHLVAFKKEQEL